MYEREKRMKEDLEELMNESKTSDNKENRTMKSNKK